MLEEDLQSRWCGNFWIPSRPLTPAVSQCLGNMERLILDEMKVSLESDEVGSSHHVRLSNHDIELLQNGHCDAAVD